jgi:hypothetical protein
MSDNLLLAALLVLPLAGSSSTLWGKILYAIVILAIPGLFVSLLSVVIQRFRLWRMGARQLSLEHGRQLLEEVEEVAKNCGLNRVSVYWVSRNFTVGARVFGVLRKKIVLTGGLCVLAKRSNAQSGSIIAHEIAHLRNGDTGLFLLISLLVTTSLTNLFTGALVEHPYAAFGTFLLVPLIIYLLRRREFIADCLAINALHDPGVYLGLLLSPSTSHGIRWPHPSAATRCRGVLHSSPILKTSPWFILAALTFMIALFQNRGVRLDPTSQILFGLPLPGLAILFELSKGFSSKRPAALGETASASPKGNWRVVCAARVEEAREKLRAAGDTEGAAVLQRIDGELLHPIYTAGNKGRRIRWLLRRSRRSLAAIALTTVALLTVGHFLILAIRGPVPTTTIVLNDYTDKLAVMNGGSIVFLKGGTLYRKTSRDARPIALNLGAWIYDFNGTPTSTRLSVNYMGTDKSTKQTSMFEAISQARDELLPTMKSEISGVFSRSGRLYATSDGASRLKTPQKTGYIGADHPAIFTLRLQQSGGPYIPVTVALGWGAFRTCMGIGHYMDQAAVWVREEYEQPLRN